MQNSCGRERDFSLRTTEMVRVAFSSVGRTSSPGKKILSFAWLAGAALVVLTYLILPMLILFHQFFNVFLEVLLAANVFLAIELVISSILLRIARPTRAPTTLPQGYWRGKDRLPVLPVTDAPQQLPITPVPASLSPEPFAFAPPRSMQFKGAFFRVESRQA